MSPNEKTANSIQWDTNSRPEELYVTTGTRSGLPIAVVVASTVLGPALGGC
jgi:tetrahydromethanopterin S-methyltransferase subunit D